MGAKKYRKKNSDHPHSRSAKFLNRSGAKVDFFWVHPETGELAHSHTNGDGKSNDDDDNVLQMAFCATNKKQYDLNKFCFVFSFTGIVWGAESGINTFVGHEFEVLEISVVQGMERCLKKNCRRARFVINENEDQGTLRIVVLLGICFTFY